MINSVEQLIATSKVCHEVEVVGRFKVVDERENVLVALRDALEHNNLILDHVLAALHQSFADDFGGVLLASLDMYSLFDNRVRSVPKGASLRGE